MDLFVLDTPLQLLNAIEARHYFGNRPSALLLLRWPAWPTDAFRDLLAEMEWQKIIWVSMGIQRPLKRYPIIGSTQSERINEYVWVYRNYQRRRSLDRALECFGQVSWLVVGNLRNEYMRHIVWRVPHTEVIAVDDGTDTLQVAVLRRNPIDTLRKSLLPRLIKSPKRFIQERWVDWDCRQPDAITFFTAYDIQTGRSDRLIRNQYCWLRGRMIGRDRNGYVYFLGQPLIEDGYLDETTYFDYLQKIVRYFKDKRIIYIPHKRESLRTIGLVESELRLAVMRFRGPIEVVLALEGKLPDVLASFFCSALENCSIIFGSYLKIIAFYLPSHVLLYSDSPAEKIYDYFRRRKTEAFQVVEI